MSAVDDIVVFARNLWLRIKAKVFEVVKDWPCSSNVGHQLLKVAPCLLALSVDPSRNFSTSYELVNRSFVIIEAGEMEVKEAEKRVGWAVTRNCRFGP